MKKKIAVLGGGPGGLATAFYLSQPGVGDRYDITVYQLGWRLGGKCASGRNEEKHQRSEEHGIHVLMGCYENAFDLLRSVFDELDRPAGAPLSSCFEGENAAFVPWEWDVPGGQSNTPGSTEVSLMERVDGEWGIWNLGMPDPRTEGLPGDALRDDDPGLDLWEVFQGLFHYMRFRCRELEEAGADFVGAIGASEIPWYAVRAGLTPRDEMTPGDLLEEAETVMERRSTERRLRARDAVPLIPTLLWVLDQVDNALEGVHTADNDRHRQFLTELLLWIAVARGMLRDGVLLRGCQVIDHHEFTDWLKIHGASETVRQSAMMSAVYAGPISYDPSDDSKRHLSACTALRFLMRMFFDYRTAFFYRMQAGMGEAVIMPVYEALKKRGVKFEFFHRVESVIPEGKTIVRVELTRQVDLKDPDSEYDPVVTVKGVPCWPNEPKYHQIVDAQAEQLRRLKNDPGGNGLDLESFWLPEQGWETKVTLEAGRDFDRVVLAIPVGAHRTVCRELIARNRRWRKMVDASETILTQNVQFYTNKTPQEMGWAGSEPGISLAFTRPLDSWVDYTQVLRWEDFPDNWKVKHAAYLLDSLTDPDTIPEPGTAEGERFAREQTERVRAGARDYLGGRVRELWPGFNWDCLAGDKTVPKERFEEQYFRANVNPSDRYVLSPPNRRKLRIKTDASGYENLTLAGDWIENFVHVGSFEGTVMSAKMAARSIAGEPELIYGESDVEPRTIVVRLGLWAVFGVGRLKRFLFGP